MTIKIIDLLNKIAKGEEVPKKIKCDGVIYNYEFQNTITGAYEYRSQNYNCLMNNMAGHLYLTDILNDEVEVIEEEKEDNFSGWKMYSNEKEVYSMEYSNEEIIEENKAIKKMLFIKENDEYLVEKINELIDEVNKLKGKYE